MKFYKKLVMIFITSLLFVIFSSCSSNENLKEDFIDYYQEQLNDYTLTTTLNTEVVIVGLDKEHSTDNPRIVLNIGIGGNSKTSEQTCQWLQSSPDERKADLKECGDMVTKYAQDNNWSNDYYLYVMVSNIYDGCSIVYDYEQDKIYIPNCENTFLEMYQKFGTFYKKELEETQEGIDFLVENNLAYIKHNQIEYRNIFSYTVFISEGEFKSYGEDDSIMY